MEIIASFLCCLCIAIGIVPFAIATLIPIIYSSDKEV